MFFVTFSPCREKVTKERILGEGKNHVFFVAGLGSKFLAEFARR